MTYKVSSGTIRASVCCVSRLAGVTASSRQMRPSFARPGAGRTGSQLAPSTVQPLPPVVQNGCEDMDAGDAPPQKPANGMMWSCAKCRRD